MENPLTEYGVFDATTSRFMARAAENPGAGQYVFDGGMYAFAAADEGHEVHLLDPAGRPYQVGHVTGGWFVEFKPPAVGPAEPYQPHKPQPPTTAPLTAAEIAELRELHEKATMAPWSPDGAFLFLCLGDEAVRDVYQGDEEKQNEALACAARNALPALLDEVTRARALLKRIEWSGTRRDDAPTCPGCGGFAPNLVTNPDFEQWPPPFQGTKVDHAGHKPGCELAALIGGK